MGSFSDMQGFVNPPRVRGRGQKGKGQGTMFDQVIETCTDIETVDYLCIHLL